MNRKKEEALRSLYVKLELCKDGNTDLETAQYLRDSLYYMKEAKNLNIDQIKQMLEMSQNLQEKLRHGYINTARMEAENLKKTADELRRNPGGNKKKMGIWKTLFGVKKNQEDVRSEQIDTQLKQAEENVKKIKWQLSHLSDQWEECYKEIEKLAEESVKMNRKSPRYNQLLIEAKGKQDQMKILEGQMKQYTAALQNNTQYRILLDNGRITIDLQNMIPDIAKAEVLMDQIAQGTETVGEKITDLENILERENKRVLGAMEQKTDRMTKDMGFFAEMQKKAIDREKEEQKQKEKNIQEKSEKENKEQELDFSVSERLEEGCDLI